MFISEQIYGNLEHLSDAENDSAKFLIIILLTEGLFIVIFD